MSWKEATAGKSVEKQEQGPNPDNQNGLKAVSLLDSRLYVVVDVVFKCPHQDSARVLECLQKSLRTENLA